MPRIENGGWHYSYMGGAKSVIQKVVSKYDGNLNSPWKTEEAAKTSNSCSTLSERAERFLLTSFQHLQENNS
jgi:hypothetical protein